MSLGKPLDRVTYITQGEQALGNRPDEVISTILGSCVSVCLWDPSLRIGGMNHIVLPTDERSSGTVDGIGACAMEQLINALLKQGARKSAMEAKVFGGASIVAGLSNIGARNVEFAFTYLQREGVSCSAQSIGGTSARQVKFWPFSGRARQRLVADATVDTIQTPAPRPVRNDVELF